MGCNFHPVILQHVLQGIVAGQRRKPSFPCKILNVITFYIFHAELFKGDILLFQNGKLSIYLIKKKLLFEVLKGKKVKL